MDNSNTNSLVPQELPKVGDTGNRAKHGRAEEVLSYDVRLSGGRSRAGVPGVPPPVVSWRKVARYKRTMVGIFLILVIPLGAGIWFWFEPTYTAVGKIRLQPVAPRLVFQTDDNGLIPYYESYANTQADLIRSPQLIRKTLDRYPVKKTEWYRRSYERNPNGQIDEFLEALTVQYKPKTEIIEVTMVLNDPREAAEMVNGLMEEYIQFAKNTTVQAREALYQKLSETYDVLLDDLDNRQKAAKKIRQEVAGGAKDKFQFLSDEEETIRHKKELADTLRSRLDQKEFERGVPSSIEVMAAAEVPSQPSEDRRKKLALATVLAGLVAGMGTGYLRARASKTFYDPQDICELLEEPSLGRVPHVFPKRPLTGKENADQADAIRRVRTLLLSRLGGEPGTILSLASSHYGAGKTAVAILLAKSLTLAGKKVLLVDANLEKPMLGDYFGIPKAPGLQGVLVKTAEGSPFTKTDHPLLDLLPAGTGQHKSSLDLFSDGTLAAVLRQWKSQYDFILVDTPPILAAADGAVISQLADATVLVIRRRYCRRDEVIEALDYLGVCGSSFLGFVYVS